MLQVDPIVVPFTIVGKTFDEVYPQIIQQVMILGTKSSPRGMPITELLGASFVILDPTQGYCHNAQRKLNHAFGIVERWEYLYGVSDPERICFYNKQFRNYLNEATGKFDGAYGPRLLEQLEYVYELLKRDPDTRQAVLNINGPQDKHETKDVPCTISLQLFIRDGRLFMIATMRSNDLLWGTPYDVSGFTFIQEAMASWLGLGLGWYKHQAGSLHAYDSTREQLVQVMEKPFVDDGYRRPKFDLTYDETDKALYQAFMLEREARTSFGRFDVITAGNLPKCLWSDWDVVYRHLQKKLER